MQDGESLDDMEETQRARRRDRTENHSLRTQLIEISAEDPENGAIERAADMIRTGKVVAIRTGRCPYWWTRSR